MGAEIIPFPNSGYGRPDNFGGCPTCFHAKEYLNLGPTHWFFCERHRVKWCVGRDLFIDWLKEDEATWFKNAKFLADFETVEFKPLKRGCPDD